MTIQTQIIFDDDGKEIGAIIPIEDYNQFVKPAKEDLVQLSDEVKQAIDVALEQSKNGQTLSHEEVMKQTRERFPNLF